MTAPAAPSAPTVSVVIPSYNCERFIAQTLGSIVKQTFTDWEVIVVDDGSSDATVAIASSIDPRVHVVRQENAGVCVARNHGFAESRGRYLCFMDHDDYWFEEKLERQVAWMERMPELGMIYSICIYWYPTDGRFPTPESMRPARNDDVLDPDFTGWIYHQFLLDCCALTSSAMIRREALDACGAFDASLPFSEDWDLFLRISHRFPMAQMRWGSTLYRQHDRQGSRVVRDIDYRSRLLLKYARQWGLASPDGRSITPREFQAKLAFYAMEFGRMHLRYGDRRRGIRSILGAWRLDPSRLRYLAMAFAGLGGWRPQA